MNNIKACIFDLDGTIVDNNPYHQLAWVAFLKEQGISLKNFDYNSLFGKHNREILNTVLGRQVPEDEAKIYAETKERLYREFYKPHIKSQKGLVEFLKALKIRKIKTAVATSAPRINLDFVIEELQLEPYFDVLIDASFVSKSKPDPEIFLLAAEQLNAKPEECLVFEDSPSGIQAAVSAGMEVIGINVINMAFAKEKCRYVTTDFQSLCNEIQF